MSRREQESKLRLEIHRREQHLGALLQRLKSPRDLLAGSIFVRKRRCGKPGCRCVQGRLHSDRVFAVRRAGRLVLRILDPMEDASIEEGVASWRNFRRERRELKGACRDMIEAVDRLGRMRQMRFADAR